MGFVYRKLAYPAARLAPSEYIICLLYTSMQHAIKAAKTGFFPSVDFSGSYQYRINKYDLDFGPGMSVEMDHNTYSLGCLLYTSIPFDLAHVPHTTAE